MILYYISLIADSSDMGSQTSREKQHRVKCYPPDTLRGRFHREKYSCAHVLYYIILHYGALTVYYVML